MLTLENLSFSYGKKEVLSGIHLTLRPGERLAVMGASGCGKSTLLHLIAGFFSPTGGKLQCEFQKIAYVFQEPRLFPWLTAEENVRAVLGGKREEQDERIKEALALVELEEAGSLYPSELSGGMQARVSIARAMAYQPDLLLLDEPFAALNEELRNELLERLTKRLNETETAAVMVTHTDSDAEKFAQRTLRL